MRKKTSSKTPLSVGKWNRKAANNFRPVSGEEVEAYMIENGLLQKSEAEPDSPIDSSCTPEIHAAKAAAKLAEKEARQASKSA